MSSSLNFRFLWTIDHSMEWALDEPGVVPFGCNNRYRKSPQSYLKDYKAVIDYLSDWDGVNGVHIGGFLRREHGGVRTAKELCRYAKSKDVLIFPCVGTSGYGGFYYKDHTYDANHPYSMGTWLRNHPDLRAVGKDGQLYNIICPSKEANWEWLREGTRWMYENFEIGGLYLEHGDYGVCYCKDCVKEFEKSGEVVPYFSTMVLCNGPVAETALEIDPKTRIIYVTYTGFDKAPDTASELIPIRNDWRKYIDLGEHPPRFPEKLPPQVITMWTLTGMIDEDWPPGLRPPTKRSVGYTHWGSQWTGTRGNLIVEHIQNLCKNSARAGLEGLSIHGEMSPTKMPWEMNYLAYRYFTQNPYSKMEDFARQSLSSLFGGEGAAVEAVRLLFENSPSALQEAKRRSDSATDPMVQKRWSWIVEELRRRRIGIKGFQSYQDVVTLGIAALPATRRSYWRQIL